jgi:hypothetical protein
MALTTTITGSFGRYYLHTLTNAPTAIPAASLKTHDGKQITRAVGRVEGAAAMMGMLGILTPSAAVGFLLEDKDVIVLEGHANISKALFILVSGSPTIKWILTAS